jgi:phenylalanyl-tRNA synthetase beta chain
LTDLYFRIPDFRKDLTREIDIIEEYTRFIGYKNFKEILPKSFNSNSKIKSKHIEFIKQYFITYSFNEILSNSLTSDLKFNRLSIKIQNPLNKDLALLRSSLITNLLDTFYKNLRSSTNLLKFFEIGRIYLKNEDKIIEKEYFSCIFPILNSKDSNLDWFLAKGFIENFLSFFSTKKYVFEKEEVNDDYYHPKKLIRIKENGEIIGFFGEIHPKYKKLNSIKQNVYLFELNLNSLNSKSLESKLQVSNEYSKYPFITKDLSIIISRKINFYDLKTFIITSIEDLKHIEFFDIYFDTNSFDVISLGIRLEFQSYSKTLVNEEIELKIQKLLLLLKEKYKIQLKI